MSNDRFRTSRFQRVCNCFRRSKSVLLPDLAEEFLRIYNGRFHYPIGFRVSRSRNPRPKDVLLVLVSHLLWERKMAVSLKNHHT